jgi:hypothetical protein
MTSEQVYPDNVPKTLRRTVYLSVSTEVEITVDSSANPEDRYVATPVDFPECRATGYSQEGAAIAAERRLKDHVRQTASTGGNSR